MPCVLPREVLPANMAKDCNVFERACNCEAQLMLTRPPGLMDKASDFSPEDCGFESRKGRDKFCQHTRRVWDASLGNLEGALASW